ncbi:hypothetical protein PG996_006640 [Apiospora saccharicola]|uniref:Uncharacterized protein n=1 Tax=Apiospora saccharicola TaxID=335842 RepID=A0ABR1V8J8_9PEZI
MLDRPDQLSHHEEDVSSNDARRQNWYEKHRKCEDGSVHFGELELITWGGEEAGWELGWGRTQVSEVEFMKKKYEQEFGGDDEKLYEYWPQGFRTGMSVPEDLYYSKLPERQGLHLSRGPDPRSHGFHAMMSMQNFNNYELAM